MEETSEDEGPEPLSCVVCGRGARNKCSVCKEAAYCGREHQKLDWKSHRTRCRPFEIRKSPELGRYLVSTKDVPACSMLLVESPLVVGPRLSGSGPLCLGCLEVLPPSGPAAPCPGCLWPACSPTCPGLASPKAHALECRLLRAQTTGRLPEPNYDIITPLRCLLLQKTNPKKWNDLMAMESHMDKRGKTTEIYREIQNIVDYLMDNCLSHLPADFLPNANPEVIHKICGILDVNGLEITRGGEEVLAIYPTACLMEHSCLPNTKHTFDLDDFRIKLQSSVDISKNEHVSTMYTHALWGTMARRAHLKEMKYFECHCLRCADPTELGTHFSSLKCIGEKGLIETCGDTVLPTDPLKEDSDWRCASCPLVLNSDHVADLISRISGEVEEALQNPKLEKLEKMVENLEKLLHKNHYQIYMVKHSLIQLYGREIPHEELTEEILNKKIEMIKDMLEVNSCLDPGNGRICLYTSVLHYELHSALLERSNRVGGYEAKEELWREAQEELEIAAGLLVSEAPAHAPASLLALVTRKLDKVNKMLDRNCKIVELD